MKLSPFPCCSPLHQTHALQGDKRQVSKAEGIAFARKHGALLVETSAKGNVAVDQAFEELVLKILDTPSLLGASSTGLGLKSTTNGRGRGSSCC